MANNFRTFLEKRLRIKIVPKQQSTGNIDLNNDIGTFLEGLENSSMLDTSQLEQFRTISTDRETRYRLYDEMCLDAVIASALELYADDATQYNSKGQIIWAESEDQNVSNFANRIIDVLNINENAWSHIYSLVKYGDVYLELFKDTEVQAERDKSPFNTHSSVNVVKYPKGSYLEEYVNPVSNPAEIFDLTRRGKTVGFIKTKTQDASPLEPRFFYQHTVETNTTDIMPADKFVHITLANNTDRFPEKLSITYKSDDEDTEIEQVDYTVKSGKSILHDVYKSYKELKLMEDSLLLNRVTRSSIIRLLQVEVGEMPKTQAKELMRRIKLMIEQKNFMDKDSGTFQSMASPGPIDNVIYVPTKDGKGTITASNIGGDVDVKSIVDLDYFKNKFFGGLKIPKQFLGDTDDPAGFSGGSSLTKLDSRYARTVKRIQNAYISGITTLINIFALSFNLPDHVNKFTVKMVSPSTVEDQERDEILSKRLDMVSSFMGLISDDIFTTPYTRKEMLLYFMNNYLNEPELANMFVGDDTVQKTDESEDEENMDDGADGGFGSFDDDSDFGGGMDNDMGDSGTPDFDF